MIATKRIDSRASCSADKPHPHCDHSVPAFTLTTFSNEKKADLLNQMYASANALVMHEDRALYWKLFADVQTSVLLLGIVAWTLSNLTALTAAAWAGVVLSLFGAALSFGYWRFIEDSLDCIKIHKTNRQTVVAIAFGGDPLIPTSPSKLILNFAPLCVFAGWITLLILLAYCAWNPDLLSHLLGNLQPLIV